MGVSSSRKFIRNATEPYAPSTNSIFLDLYQGCCGAPSSTESSSTMICAVALSCKHGQLLLSPSCCELQLL